jgi:hypothetical protein
MDDRTADGAGFSVGIFIIFGFNIGWVFRDIPPLLCALAPDVNALFGGAVLLLGHIFL